MENFSPKNGELFYYNNGYKINCDNFDEGRLLHRCLRSLKVIYRTENEALKNFVEDCNKLLGGSKC